MSIELDWISVHDRLPQKTGWYKVKTIYGDEITVPISTTLGGKLVWVFPNENIIQYWKDKID